jgi:hypothetical protein
MSVSATRQLGHAFAVAVLTGRPCLGSCHAIRAN